MNRRRLASSTTSLLSICILQFSFVMLSHDETAAVLIDDQRKMQYRLDGAAPIKSLELLS